MIGLIHAYDLTPSGVHNKFGIAASPEFAIMYGLSAAFLLLVHFAGGSGDAVPPKDATLEQKSAPRSV
jgi:hypothetical protein